MPAVLVTGPQRAVSHLASQPRQPRPPPSLRRDGVQIQQRLRRVLPDPVPGVDHRSSRNSHGGARGSLGRMSQHDRVAVRQEAHYRVLVVRWGKGGVREKKLK